MLNGRNAPIDTPKLIRLIRQLNSANLSDPSVPATHGLVVASSIGDIQR